LSLQFDPQDFCTSTYLELGSRNQAVQPREELAGNKSTSLGRNFYFGQARTPIAVSLERRRFSCNSFQPQLIIIGLYYLLIAHPVFTAAQGGEMQERSEPVLPQRAFVGREGELVELRQGLAHTLAGAGCLFLISGEPGIGKTRLAQELSTEARARGTRVIWGRCWAGDGAPAYWPWMQVVRSCLGEADGTRIDNLLKSEAPQVTDLLPELNQFRRSSAVAPSLHAVPLSDPEEGRFRLFDSLGRLLKTVADAQPLMIVLDDLQEADQSSLLMLRFSARQLKESRVLIIGTYREGEVRNSPALSRLIGEIAREGHQLLVHGLSDSELASWIQVHDGLNTSPGLVRALIQATGGNPLFIDGVLRTLIEDERQLTRREFSIRDLPVPDGIRETIRRRLGFLSKDANEILSIAAAKITS
jgi:predicted ATPase